MSPTLLEGLVIVVLLVVAWQLGLTIAPEILRWYKRLSREVDEAVQAAEEEPAHHSDAPLDDQSQEQSHGTRK